MNRLVHLQLSKVKESFFLEEQLPSQVACSDIDKRRALKAEVGTGQKEQERVSWERYESSDRETASSSHERPEFPTPPDYHNQKSRRQFCMVKLFVRFLIILGQKTVQSQLCYDKLLLP